MKAEPLLLRSRREVVLQDGGGHRQRGEHGALPDIAEPGGPHALTGERRRHGHPHLDGSGRRLGRHGRIAAVRAPHRLLDEHARDPGRFLFEAHVDHIHRRADLTGGRIHRPVALRHESRLIVALESLRLVLLAVHGRIAAEDHHGLRQGRRLHLAENTGQPHRHVLHPAQRAQRLGEIVHIEAAGIHDILVKCFDLLHAFAPSISSSVAQSI